MELKTPPYPIDLAEFKSLPYLERIRFLTRRWAEYGADSPRIVHIFYVLKIALFVFGGIALIGNTTPGLGGLTSIQHWYGQPIAYEKAIVFTMLFEVLGFGGGSGPLSFKYLPPVTSFLHFSKVGTIRQPIWPNKVPFTKGDTRTIVDVALYVAFVGTLVATLFSNGTTAHFPGSTAGVIEHPYVITYLVLLTLIGLRDKVVYLAARAEMYWVASFVFLFPHADMLMGFKAALCAIWLGAGISKLTHNFPFAVQAMISNAPLRPKFFKRATYRNFPTDMRPSAFGFGLAHIGTVFELGGPVALLSLHGDAQRIAVIAMVIFHLHIVSTIPMGVPNEWNVFMMYGTIFLFWAHGGVGFGSVQHPWLIALLVVALLAPVVIGNLFPSKVSFLTAMRYYAANWCTAIWCFQDGSFEKIPANVVRVAGTMEEQLEKLYDKDFAEYMAIKMRAFRAMHPHGRGQSVLLQRTFENLDDVQLMDGEVLQSSVCGWMFGDAHMHDERLMASVQKRCNFKPGELTLIIMESQPIHKQRQEYRVVDAVLGELERGYIDMRDMINAQPALDAPNYTLPVDVIRRNVPADQPYLQTALVRQ